MNIKSGFVLLLFTLIISSCALYEPQYRNEGFVKEFPADKKPEKIFYLVGDAGKSPMGGKSEGLVVFEKFLEDNPTSGNYTLFLGDNIYPIGMEPKDSPKRKYTENMIDAQYETVKNFDGEVIFIPGNHEWYNGGLPGVKREEDYVEMKFNNKDTFKPSNGCPIESIEVSENIQLIMIDSQWYLANWNNHPTMNENCDIKSRDKLFITIENELQNHQNKTIVFAMHHPMLTNGSHGGYFGAEKHLYPTQANWPLPVLSTLVTQIRAQGGVSVQDRYNELYNNLMIRLKNTTKNSDRLIFVSGHEHNLQYLENDGVKQIVSGSGAKESFASLGNDGLFCTGAQGFATYHIFEDGSSWVRYYIGDEKLNPKLVFEKEVFPPKESYDTTKLPTKFANEVAVPIYRQDSISESLFFKTVWGERYKEAFSTPVKVEVAKLDSLYGGLEVIREGGEKEYRSLRLKDNDGNEYRMRALGKNSLQYSQRIVTENIPEDTNQDFTEQDETTNYLSIPDTFDADFYTASHPYAVLAIPKLAQTIDVFYTDSKLYYVPKQRTLGDYNENFGGELYLISFLPTENSEGEQIFEYPDAIQTTDDILIEIRKQSDIVVDESNYIRSRLFEMLLGDWDRESDHWRWAKYRNAFGKDVFVPIPRNRDDAFSSFDGNILNAARSIFSGSRETHVYGEDLTDLEWFNEEGIILDRALLQKSGREQWIKEARIIQDKLSQEIIDEAFNTIPEQVQDEELQLIKEKLVARKSNLQDIANRYYSYLSNLQTITGTDSDDYFEINRLQDGVTEVKSFRYKDGKKSEFIVNQQYNHDDTREVWIYGLGGNDVFEVKGEDSDLIFVRAIGGKGNDKFITTEARRVKFYDFKTTLATIDGDDDGVIFTNLYDINTYDYRKQIDDSKRVAPTIGYNPDDGLRVGLEFIYTVNSFKRNPFSKRHNLKGGYYFDTSSFDFDYTGEFANSFGDLNLKIGARITSSNFNANYFGFGNETVNLEDTFGIEHNRVDLQTISAKIGLVKNSNFGSVFNYQARFEAITLNDSNTNLYVDKGQTQINNTDYFVTLEGIYNYRSFDNALNPSRGMMFDLQLGAKENVENLDRIYGFLNSRLGFYNALSTDEKLVLKTNVRTQFIFGGSYEFYQGVKLGANTGLRGFREERFTGKSSLTGSADVRYSFNQFTVGLIPVQIGIYGGADLGRVWIPNGTSEKWHNSYGGGLWVNSQGGLGGTFSIFNSVEGTRINFGVGLSF